MPTRRLNTDKLKEASNHLWYEIWMFQRLVPGMASGIAGEGVLNNAMLESFAIHVRALIHFFYAENPQRDDVVAAHFFVDPARWKAICPPMTRVLAVAKKRADKEVAHLTYARQKVTADKKPWTFVPIYQDLQKPISIFLGAIPKDLLGARWAATIASTAPIGAG